MPTQPRVFQSAVPNGIAEGTFSSGVASRFGAQVILDFYTYMALLGAGFQIRAGTITTPLVGAVPITDTQAELCADCVAGTTIIPVQLGLGVRLGTGTLHEYALKSVGSVSSAGTAFTPLPLKMGGNASVSTARVAAHAVTVTAELATTTRRHWEFANPVAAGAGFDPGGASNAAFEWNPKVPPILVGPACLYLQMGAAGTGPSYYAHLDFLEANTTALT